MNKRKKKCHPFASAYAEASRGKFLIFFFPSNPHYLTGSALLWLIHVGTTVKEYFICVCSTANAAPLVFAQKFAIQLNFIRKTIWYLCFSVSAAGKSTRSSTRSMREFILRFQLTHRCAAPHIHFLTHSPQCHFICSIQHLIAKFIKSCFMENLMRLFTELNCDAHFVTITYSYLYIFAVKGIHHRHATCERCNRTHWRRSGNLY